METRTEVPQATITHEPPPMRPGGTPGTADQHGHHFRRLFRNLGPGLITGAADDDPSGISTYSVAGAAFGMSSLWTALFSYPLMTSVQLMCARLGLVSGRGLAGVVRLRYPRWVLWGACSLLVVANVFNIGADLAGMAEVTRMMTGIPGPILVPAFGLLIVSLLFWASYHVIVRVFKALTLVLFAYVAAAFLAGPEWGAVLQATFVPRIQWSSTFFAMIVGVLGTTISPYLFFWQAAEEVEDERALGRRTVEARKGATDEELLIARDDVMTGMGYSNLIMYFIMLTTAATLHASGNTDIATAREAAEALRPLAGEWAYLLFSLGLIGTGMLGVPVLAGSAAYAVSEAMNWGGSLDDRPRMAPKFYAVVAVAMCVGLALASTGVDAVRMLFWAAVLNGVLAPPLVALVVLASSDRSVMGDRVSSRTLRVLGWTTAVVMTAAAVAMLVTS